MSNYLNNSININMCYIVKNIIISQYQIGKIKRTGYNSMIKYMQKPLMLETCLIHGTANPCKKKKV